MVRHYVSIALAAVLLSFGCLLGASGPTRVLAYGPYTSTFCANFPLNTDVHWDSAQIEHYYGHGTHVTRVQIRWTLSVLSGYRTVDAWARIEGDNGRAPTPFDAEHAQGAMLLSTGEILYTSVDTCGRQYY